MTQRKAVFVLAVLLIAPVLDRIHPLRTGPTNQECPLAIVMGAMAVAGALKAKKAHDAAKAAGQNADADTAMTREDQQQALRRRQNVLSQVFANYKLDPTKYGLGQPLGEGGVAQTPVPGALDYFRMADMPERDYGGSGWLGGAVEGALGGAASYYGTKPAAPEAVPSVAPRTGVGGGGYVGGSDTGGGYALSPLAQTGSGDYFKKKPTGTSLSLALGDDTEY